MAKALVKGLGLSCPHLKQNAVFSLLKPQQTTQQSVSPTQGLRLSEVGASGRNWREGEAWSLGRALEPRDKTHQT